MDGSRFDWEIRHHQGKPANEGDRAFEAAPAEAVEIERRVADAALLEGDRPGAPMSAWAPVLIWMTLGVTVAISAAL